MAEAPLTCGEVCGRRSAFLSVSDGVNIDSVLSCWSQWAHLKLHRVSRNLLWYRWHCAEKHKNQKSFYKTKKDEKQQLNNRCGFILGCWHVRQWQQCPAVWHTILRYLKLFLLYSGRAAAQTVQTSQTWINKPKIEQQRSFFTSVCAVCDHISIHGRHGRLPQQQCLCVSDIDSSQAAWRIQGWR